MHPYKGSCHCGAVEFEIDYEPFELTTCDCSLCVKKHALMCAVPQSRLTITKGAGGLSVSQWNLKTARQYFCRTCGIYTFHQTLSTPDSYGVNVFCLEAFDIEDYPVRKADGDVMSVTADAPARFPGPRETN